MNPRPGTTRPRHSTVARSISIRISRSRTRTWRTFVTAVATPRTRSRSIDAPLSIDARQSEAHYNLGYLFLERGENWRAIPHLRRAVVCRPDFADAHFNLGVAYERIGERPQPSDTGRDTSRLNRTERGRRRRGRGSSRRPRSVPTCLFLTKVGPYAEGHEGHP